MRDTFLSGGRRTFLKNAGVLGLGGLVLTRTDTVAASVDAVVIDEPGVYELEENLDRPVRITADDVTLNGADEYAINVEDGPAVTVTGDDVAIREVDFRSRGGVLYQGSRGGFVELCQFRASQGLRFDDCFRTGVWNNQFFNCLEPIMLVDSDECLVRGNRMYKPEFKAINVNRGYGNVVTNNDVDRSQNRDGIYAVDTRRVTFSGNWSNDNKRAGLHITRSNDAVLTGNRFTGNEGQRAIVVTDSDDVLVIGNYDIDGGNVYVEGGSDDVTVFGNHWD